MQVLAAGFEDNIHQVILFRGALGDYDIALLVEHPGDRARFRHVTAVLSEAVANFANRTVAIVGVDVEQNGHTPRTVAFE